MTRAEQLLITRKLLLGERGWIIHDGEGDPSGGRDVQALLWRSVDTGNLFELQPWQGSHNWYWGYHKGEPGTIMAYRFTD